MDAFHADPRFRLVREERRRDSTVVRWGVCPAPRCGVCRREVVVRVGGWPEGWNVGVMGGLPSLRVRAPVGACRLVSVRREIRQGKPAPVHER